MDKTIQCPHCDKKYARQTDLNTHLLSHTGDKPYSCQLCPSRFVRQANLNKHMNQQHAEKANASKLTQLIDDTKSEGIKNKFNSYFNMHILLLMLQHWKVLIFQKNRRITLLIN